MTNLDNNLFSKIECSNIYNPKVRNTQNIPNEDFFRNAYEMIQQTENYRLMDPSLNIQQIYSKIYNRLDYLSTLKEGWDGFYAKPMQCEVLARMKELLKSVNIYDLDKWVIFLDLDGNLYLDSKSKDAGINIYGDSFSYFYEDEVLYGENHIVFSADKLIKIMNLAA